MTPDGDTLRELLGFATVAATGEGESRGAFWVTDAAGTVSVLKVLPDPAGDLAGHLRTLDGMVARLRERRYPAPRITAVGELPGHVYWVQEKMPGARLADSAAVAALLPELIRLNDAQADVGGTDDGTRFAGLLRTTLTVGGDGYCLHETLADDPDSAEVLHWARAAGERCGAAIPPRHDYVHFDWNPANLLSDGEHVTAVVDMNPPPLIGDRAFDLVTLMFYCYDDASARDRLWARVLELTSAEAATIYLAHITLRQVEWSIRHYPDAALTRHFRRVAAAIIRDMSATSLGEKCGLLGTIGTRAATRRCSRARRSCGTRCGRRCGPRGWRDSLARRAGSPTSPGRRPRPSNCGRYPNGRRRLR